MCYTYLNVEGRTAAESKKTPARSHARLKIQHKSRRITFLSAFLLQTFYNHILSKKQWGVPHS